jgi:hypothetical protein
MTHSPKAFVRRPLRIFLKGANIVSVFFCMVFAISAMMGESGQRITLWRLIDHDLALSKIPFDLPSLTTPPASELHLLRFDWDVILRTDGLGNWWIARALHIPNWFLCLTTAILPTLMFQQWLRRCRRKANGQCLTCGYDLQATPHRCPECGTNV